MPIINRDNTQIYYETKGHGPAIVFAHGAGGNAAIWFNQVAHFSEHFQCIAFDHRSFARSPLPATAITVHQFRDDLIAILDELGVDQAHLVGQSMGGFTALRTTLDTPERVLSLTMSCTGGGIYNPNPSPALRNLTSNTDRSGGNGVLATMAQKSQGDAALMQLYESINNFNTAFDWSNLATLLGKDDVVPVEALSRVNVPTLFISGEEDPLFPPELLSSFVPHFSNARIEVVKDTGHSPYFERPAEFNRLLETHLTNV